MPRYSISNVPTEVIGLYAGSGLGYFRKKSKARMQRVAKTGRGHGTGFQLRRVTRGGSRAKVGGVGGPIYAEIQYI